MRKWAAGDDPGQDLPRTHVHYADQVHLFGRWRNKGMAAALAPVVRQMASDREVPEMKHFDGRFFLLRLQLGRRRRLPLRTLSNRTTSHTVHLRCVLARRAATPTS